MTLITNKITDYKKLPDIHNCAISVLKSFQTKKGHKATKKHEITVIEKFLKKKIKKRRIKEQYLSRY